MTTGTHVIHVNLSRLAAALRTGRSLTQDDRVFLVHLIQMEMAKSSDDPVPLITTDDDREGFVA